MARFFTADAAYLKTLMLPRLPACLFEEEDYAAVAADTHLTRCQAQSWSRFLRFKFPEAQREAYLRREREKV